MRDFDVVIVGGGIGGGALAAVLAERGLAVLVLEKERVYRDRVRGEWLAPWGVVEAQRLGLYARLRVAGGHHLAEHRTYHDGLDAAATASIALDLGALLPDVPGPLCLGHPAMCRTLATAAAEAGAEVRHGIDAIELGVFADGRRTVRFRDEGATSAVRARLVVGADGRGSVMRWFLAAFAGPDALPPEAFDESVRARLLAA